MVFWIEWLFIDKHYLKSLMLFLKHRMSAKQNISKIRLGTFDDSYERVITVNINIKYTRCILHTYTVYYNSINLFPFHLVLVCLISL